MLIAAALVVHTILSCFVSTIKSRFNASYTQTPNSSIATQPSSINAYECYAHTILTSTKKTRGSALTCVAPNNDVTSYNIRLPKTTLSTKNHTQQNTKASANRFLHPAPEDADHATSSNCRSFLHILLVVSAIVPHNKPPQSYRWIRSRDQSSQTGGQPLQLWGRP